MEELFKYIADKENGECNINYEKEYTPYVFLPLVMRENGLQIKNISLDIEYNKHKITSIYELGDNHFATITATLNDVTNIPNFEVRNTSHYWRIFNKKKNILNVKCTESNFKEFIQMNLLNLGIEEIARNNQFEPKIIGKRNKESYILSTKYHLAFADKKKILEPLINFYKLIIEYSTS